jgi:hypothetical protein
VSTCHDQIDVEGRQSVPMENIASRPNREYVRNATCVRVATTSGSLAMLLAMTPATFSNSATRTTATKSIPSHGIDFAYSVEIAELFSLVHKHRSFPTIDPELPKDLDPLVFPFGFKRCSCSTKSTTVCKVRRNDVLPPFLHRAEHQ